MTNSVGTAQTPRLRYPGQQLFDFTNQRAVMIGLGDEFALRQPVARGRADCPKGPAGADIVAQASCLHPCPSGETPTPDPARCRLHTAAWRTRSAGVSSKSRSRTIRSGWCCRASSSPFSALPAARVRSPRRSSTVLQHFPRFLRPIDDQHAALAVQGFDPPWLRRAGLPCPVRRARR